LRRYLVGRVAARRRANAFAVSCSMKILLCSVPFRPSTGGIETVSAVLAEQFHRRGHAVTLVTQTPAGEPDSEPYPIVRRPSTAQMWRLVKQADVVFHNNISLRMAWPLLALPYAD
jgi:glycogen synthase